MGSKDYATDARLAYVRSLLGELRTVSDMRGCEMLCYLIEMAYLEAGDRQLEMFDQARRDLGRRSGGSNSG